MTNRSVNLKNQSFASALKTITSLAYIFVDPASGDDTNNGLSITSPFQTIQKAFDYLNDKYITTEGFVVIKLAAGVHVVTETIVISHPNGDRISICGAEPSVRHLKQVTAYGVTGTSGATAFGDYSREITMVVVGGSSAAGFTEVHGLTSMADHGILVKNVNLDTMGQSSIRNKFADEVPNAAHQAGVLGCHRIASYTANTVVARSHVKNTPIILPANQYIAGEAGVEYQLGGNSTPAETYTTIACDGSPVGYYGDIHTVGRTAETALGITAPADSYLYNITVPAGTQVTPDDIEVVFMPTVIQSATGVFEFINSGLRSIRNVVIDGIAQNGRDAVGATSRVAMRFVRSTLGKQVVRTPEIGLIPTEGTENFGILNFTTGIAGEDSATLSVGDPTISNCFLGIFVTDNTSMHGERLTITGSDHAGILALNNASVVAPFSFIGMGGLSYSLVLFSPQGITTNSFTRGDQIVQITDRGLQILGQVSYWDNSAGILLTNHVQGAAENRPTYRESFAITGAAGGTYSTSSSFAQGTILAVTPIVTGCGALALNNSFVWLSDSIGVFNKLAGFAAFNTSSLWGQRSLALGNGVGFMLSNGSMGDVTSGLGILNGAGVAMSDNAQMTANMFIAMNNISHSFQALNSSSISAVGYEARSGSLGQADFHFFAANGSKIVNSQPTHVDTTTYVRGATLTTNLFAPTEGFADSYTAITV